MAKRTASAKKQARAGARRTSRNRAARSEVKTLIVKARRSLSDGGVDAAERAAMTMEAVRKLDRVAAKGVLHPNNAARRKSRLARRLAKVASSTPAPTKGKKAAAASTPRATAPRATAAPKKK